MFFTALQSFFVVFFAGAVAWAWWKVFQRRNTPDNAWMLAFAHFSLAAWILWILEYVNVIATQLDLVPIELSRNASLWLATMHNVVWATAILSLHSKQLSNTSMTAVLLIMVSILVAAIINQATISTFGLLAQIGALSVATIFFVLAVTVRQLRRSYIYAAVFLVHGFSQWIWGYLLFTSSSKFHALLLVFLFWHIALLFSWISLILGMLVTFRVMISSTIKDLRPERDAADRAVRSLNFEGWRSEKIGSLPVNPKRLCRLWAEQCDMFILLIGERYGHETGSQGVQSAVEFEYQVAYKQNRGKILVYVKDGVTRESNLEEFLKRLQDFKRGHVTSSFGTPEELYQQIRHDVPQWLRLKRTATTVPGIPPQPR